MIIRCTGNDSSLSLQRGGEEISFGRLPTRAPKQEFAASAVVHYKLTELDA